ncbi:MULTISPECIES: hypothetical protein, partial [unclassified Oceanobacter]|uniref:hypothetical protein n=1 Tax=unclassified Oceanobacter TaxID=2620260 RepID=UPI0027323786
FWSSDTSFMVAILPPTLVSRIIEPLQVNQARESANKPKFNTLKVVFNGQPDSFEAKALSLPKECKPIPGA